MKDELHGYHNQITKIKSTNNVAIERVNKRKRVF